MYLGVLVGMAGPVGILRVHDLRDWAQREHGCHVFFSHSRAFLVDAWWQLTSRFEFERPPRFSIELEFANDPFYRWLERRWILQQLPLAGLLWLGPGPNETDPAWRVIHWLQERGLVTRVGLPRPEHARDEMEECRVAT